MRASVGPCGGKPVRVSERLLSRVHRGPRSRASAGRGEGMPVYVADPGVRRG